MSFNPAFLPQSASGLRSRNSPTPKLFPLRRLKTGTATPAPCQVSAGSTTNPSLTTVCWLRTTLAFRLRLPPPSKWTKDFFERLGVKGVFKKARLVPRINHEQFRAVEAGGNEPAVATPVSGLRVPGLAQNVGISQCGAGGLRGQRHGHLPELIVHILQRHGMAGQGMRAHEPEGLAGACAKAKSEGHVHLAYFISAGRRSQTRTKMRLSARSKNKPRRSSPLCV